MFFEVERSRINRYIMECKSYIVERDRWDEYRINRYIMECKFYSTILLNRLCYELIDTLWNVNSNILFS